MASTLTVIFDRDAVDQEYFRFTLYDLNNPTVEVVVEEYWKDGRRASSNEVEVVISTAPQDILPAGGTTKKLLDSIQLDYGTANFITAINGNTVTFTAAYRPGINIEWGFVSVDFSDDLISYWVIDNGDINPMAIISQDVEAGYNCDYYQMNILTSVQAQWINLNGNNQPTDTNPIQAFFPKGIENVAYVLDADGNRADVTYTPNYYDKLAVDNITIDIVYNLASGTVTVNTTNVLNLELQYSLDGINWRTDNVFGSQSIGDYTMYVKDQFDCQVQKDYKVTITGTKEPFHYISKANSLNFVLQQPTSSCDIPKNDENTFAFQNIADLPSCTETLVQTCDTTTGQIKTNFDDVTVTLKDEAGTKTDILASKMSSNLGRFESMDCKMYNYGTGQAGIYFDSGFFYLDGWVKTDETYALNGNLPDFAVVGNTIELNGLGTFEIVSVLFDDSASIRKKVIVINYDYSGEIQTEVIACLFNVIPYEVYQFTIDWSTFNVGLYEVEVLLVDAINDNVTYITENINLAVEHEGTIRIDYYNSNNRDIFYKYGIEHRIRVPFISIQASPNSEQEINLTDNGSYVVDSIIYEADVITFDEMVKSMMRKVSIATGCEFVFINGVGYAGEAPVEFEPIGQTNLYTVTKTMVKTNVAYNTRHLGNSGVDSDYVPFDIPPLLSIGDGLLKI